MADRLEGRQREQECRVAYIGPEFEGKLRVGVVENLSHIDADSRSLTLVKAPRSRSERVTTCGIAPESRSQRYRQISDEL